MTRRLLASYLTITLFVLIVLELPLGFSFARRERDTLTRDLERDAAVLVTLVEDGLESGRPTDYQQVARSYNTRTGARVVILDAHGISLADTEFPTGRDFSSRPEIAQALSGQRATGTRHSQTLGHDLLYVAVPIASGGTVYGAVRVNFPTTTIDHRIHRTWLALGALAAVVLLAVSLVGWLLARSVTRPLRDLETASAALAGGDLSTRTDPSSGPPAVRQLAARFNDMASRIEQLLESQREFVANASHQLRTPLTALRLRLENLEPHLPPGTEADLEATVAEASRLARVIDQLLLLARAEQGALPVESVDVVATARERADMWQPVADDQGVTIRIDETEPVTARAVHGSVEQILDNYLDNALAVAPTGTVVSIEARRVDGWTELHVVDHGPGMDETSRRHAFDRFWRGASGSRPGSGLGLPIVRELAVAAGGDARLDEAPAGGIDAVVRLPSAGR